MSGTSPPVTSVKDVKISGAIGLANTLILLLLVTVSSYRKHLARSDSSLDLSLRGRFCNWLKQLPKRTYIRGCLTLFCIFNCVYYANFAFSGQYQTTTYSCHIAALSAISVAFLIFSTIWIDEMSLSKRAKICANWISKTMMLGNIVLAGVIIVANQRWGWDLIIGSYSLSYRIWFIGTESVNTLVCVAFFAQALRVCCRVHQTSAGGSNRTNVGRKLSLLVAICMVTFCLRISFNVILLCQKYEWTKPITSLPKYIWHLLYNFIPDTGLWCVIYKVSSSKAARKRAVSINNDEDEEPLDGSDGSDRLAATGEGGGGGGGGIGNPLGRRSLHFTNNALLNARTTETDFEYSRGDTYHDGDISEVSRSFRPPKHGPPVGPGPGSITRPWEPSQDKSIQRDFAMYIH